MPYKIDEAFIELKADDRQALAALSRVQAAARATQATFDAFARASLAPAGDTQSSLSASLPAAARRVPSLAVSTAASAGPTIAGGQAVVSRSSTEESAPTLALSGPLGLILGALERTAQTLRQSLPSGDPRATGRTVPPASAPPSELVDRSRSDVSTNLTNALQSALATFNRANGSDAAAARAVDQGRSQSELLRQLKAGIDEANRFLQQIADKNGAHYQ